MSFRQPNMHRNQARLCSESEQRKQECGSGQEGRERGSAHRVKRELPAASLQYTEAQQDADRTHVCHDQVQESRRCGFQECDDAR